MRELKGYGFLNCTYPVAITMVGIVYLLCLIKLFYPLWIPFSPTVYMVYKALYFLILGFFLVNNTEREYFRILFFSVLCGVLWSAFAAGLFRFDATTLIFLIFLLFLNKKVMPRSSKAATMLNTLLIVIVIILSVLSVIFTVITKGSYVSFYNVERWGDNYFIYLNEDDLYNAKGYLLPEKKTITIYGVGRFYNIRGTGYSYRG